MRRSCSPFRCSFVSVVQHKFDVDVGNVSLVRACAKARVAGDGEMKLKKQNQRINRSGEESRNLGGPRRGRKAQHRRLCLLWCTFYVVTELLMPLGLL
jgi:hypothetical protein